VGKGSWGGAAGPSPPARGPGGIIIIIITSLFNA